MKQLLFLLLAGSCYGAVTLQWDPPYLSDAEVTEYRIYRVTGTYGELIGVVKAPANEFSVDSFVRCDVPATVFYVTAVSPAGPSFPSYYVSYTK